jgi:hypothetical protein
MGADQLDRRHQRVGQHHRPEQTETELCADLGIGRDAAWIIICRTGDETRAELLK